MKKIFFVTLTIVLFSCTDQQQLSKSEAKILREIEMTLSINNVSSLSINDRLLNIENIVGTKQKKFHILLNSSDTLSTKDTVNLDLIIHNSNPAINDIANFIFQDSIISFYNTTEFVFKYQPLSPDNGHFLLFYLRPISNDSIIYYNND